MRERSSEQIVIDTWAWIEYFLGTKAGKMAQNYIEGSYKLITPSVVIAELSDCFSRMNSRQLWEERRKPFIELMSEVHLLSVDIANEAGKIKNLKRKTVPRFSLADAMIEATRKKVNGKILTGDKHFTGKNVVMISGQ